MVSPASCKDGKEPPTSERECLVPAQRSSVMSMFSFSRFAYIQWLTSVIHCWSLTMVDASSSRRQHKYNCVSSANECIVTLCSLATSARSAMYRMNNLGPSTDILVELSTVCRQLKTSNRHTVPEKICLKDKIWTPAELYHVSQTGAQGVVKVARGELHG